MVLSTQVRSASHRERKIAAMGIEAYRAEESRKRRARRAKKAVNIKPTDCKELEIKRNKSSTNTINEGNIKRLYFHITGSPFECKSEQFDLFKDTKRVIHAIDNNPAWVSDNTKNKYLESLSTLKTIQGFEAASKIYSDASVSGRTKITQSRNELKKTPREAKNWVEWKSIKRGLNSPALNDRQKALVGMYTLIPPMRVNASRLLTLTDSTRNLNPAYNYLVISKAGNPTRIIMMNYKTSKRYGKVEVKLPVRLKNIFKGHIRQNNIQIGQPVFGKLRGQGYHGAAFSQEIAKTFEKATGKYLTVDTLRHSRITEFLARRPNINQKNIMARAMLHSKATQETYERN